MSKSWIVYTIALLVVGPAASRYALAANELRLPAGAVICRDKQRALDYARQHSDFLPDPAFQCYPLAPGAKVYEMQQIAANVRGRRIVAVQVSQSTFAPFVGYTFIEGVATPRVASKPPGQRPPTPQAASEPAAVRPSGSVLAVMPLPAPQPTQPVKPVPKATMIGRGKAKICATVDIKFDTFREIKLPATIIFGDSGRLTGDIRTASVDTVGERKPAAFITTDPITLTKQSPCAEVGARMLISTLWTEPSALASESHRWDIEDVLDYPIPVDKPPIEIGELIDDVSIRGVLLTDIGDPLTLPKEETDDAATNAARCLAEAQKIAAHEKATIERQTSVVVIMQHRDAAEMSFGCVNSSLKPDLYFAWDRQAKPPAATVKLIASAGKYLTGASSDELKQELTKCVTEALKPKSSELAERESRGVKIECQAFARDGGGGSATVYRRFGASPTHEPPTAEVQARMERATAALQAREDVKALKAVEFAKWWLDPQIPTKVKTFMMISARIHALSERCPTWKRNNAVIEDAATSAGVSAQDIQPGGKYYTSLMEIMIEMRKGTAGESRTEACEIARKTYGDMNAN